MGDILASAVQVYYFSFSISFSARQLKNGGSDTTSMRKIKRQYRGSAVTLASQQHPCCKENGVETVVLHQGPLVKFYDISPNLAASEESLLRKCFLSEVLRIKNENFFLFEVHGHLQNIVWCVRWACCGCSSRAYCSYQSYSIQSTVCWQAWTFR